MYKKLNDTPIVDALTKPVAVYHLKELPAAYVVVSPAWFKLSKAEQGVVVGNDFPKWSGSIMPPPVGSQVYVNVWVEGAIGVSTVVDYYVEHGFLGVLVQPVKPPKGYAKRWKARVAAGDLTEVDARGPVTFHSMGCDLCTVEQHKARVKARKAMEKLTAAVHHEASVARVMEKADEAYKSAAHIADKVDDAMRKGQGYAVVGVDFAALAADLKNN